MRVKVKHHTHTRARARARTQYELMSNYVEFYEFGNISSPNHKYFYLQHIFISIRTFH
jgi:hypothetical protein